MKRSGEYLVSLNSIEKVKRFVSIVSKFDADVYVKSGRCVVSGKSIMGIFSIDLIAPLGLEFEYPDDFDTSLIDGYIEQIDEFLVG